MSESANISRSVVVKGEKVNEVKENPKKIDTKDDKLIELDNYSNDSRNDLQMQQSFTTVAKHLKNRVKVTIESGQATLTKSDDDHISENDDDASTDISTKDSIDDSTSGSTQGSTNDTRIPIDDKIEYIDENIESTEKQTKTKHDFVKITVDNEDFIEIPLDDPAGSEGKNVGATDDQNVDENGYSSIYSKNKKPKELVEQDNEEKEKASLQEKHTKWYYITWTFTIAVIVIILVSICGLGYFFSKDKKAYLPPIDEKTAYMQAYNVTEEDYEIDVHNNRTLARQKFPYNPYLWLPEPPSSAILG